MQTQHCRFAIFFSLNQNFLKILVKLCKGTYTCNKQKTLKHKIPMKSKYVIYTVLIMLFTSCENLLIESNEDSTPKKCFEQVWSDLNSKYVFFDYKHVNWDSVRNVYEPLFAKPISNSETFQQLSEMLASVKDGHTSLYAPTDTFRYHYYEGYKENFNKQIVDRFYLYPSGRKVEGPLEYCLLKGSVLYIYYSSFSNNLTEKNLNKILDANTNIEGIIIDIRSNSGGSNSNIYRLAEHFVESPRVMGYFRTKKTAERNSLTDAYKIVVEPRGTIFLGKVIILTNREVYSSANIFAGFMSQLPNITLIGDQTGGGTGIPTSNQLPNGWLYRFSSSYVTLANDSHFENGLQPGLFQETDSTNYSSGKDAIIEKALEVLSKENCK